MGNCKKKIFCYAMMVDLTGITMNLKLIIVGLTMTLALLEAASVLNDKREQDTITDNAKPEFSSMSRQKRYWPDFTMVGGAIPTAMGCLHRTCPSPPRPRPVPICTTPVHVVTQEQHCERYDTSCQSDCQRCTRKRCGTIHETPAQRTFFEGYYMHAQIQQKVAVCKFGQNRSKYCCSECGCVNGNTYRRSKRNEEELVAEALEEAAENNDR